MLLRAHRRLLRHNALALFRDVNVTAVIASRRKTGQEGPSVAKPPEVQATRVFEMLGIVLLRFDTLPRLWAILLIVVNAMALAFVTSPHGQIALVAVLAGIAVMAVIHRRLGFVRLLGIGHIFWAPMLIGFALCMPDRLDDPALFWWIVTLMACNTVSLVVDAIDVARFVRGERAEHYIWSDKAAC